ncbi:mucin-associated surface protein [Trypanosoma cruzi cruzi]|nr:mucin-associated surface protein [Trypanosoma cruzi cruzi]PWU92238.1 Mucin-associated surface protein (MASP) [Trypanosoma cruzi]
MAMMMTGRVLLACALCVLWCGACGGGCSETTQVSQDITHVKGDSPKSDNNSTGGAGGGGQSGQLGALKAAGLSVQEEKKAEAPLQTGTQLAPGTTDAEKKGKDQMQEVEDVVGKKDEEQEPKEDAEEEKRNGKKEEEEKKHEDAATGTTKGIPAGTEEQPSLSSAAEGASNITNPNSTPTTGDDDPAADVAGTREEKQNENKDANPKETVPAEATSMKTTTATTGDSDGSTAVSHTTSPLLLLVVVAAAAAVVAA